MGSGPRRRHGSRTCTVKLTETFNNDPARAALGLQLWRRFVQEQVGKKQAAGQVATRSAGASCGNGQECE